MLIEDSKITNKHSDEVSFKELVLKVRSWFRYLYSKRFLILIMAIIGGGIGFTYAYFKQPIYTATTTFVLEDEKSSGGMSGIAGLASMAGVDIGGAGGGMFQGDNILELYKSRKMIVETLLTETDSAGKRQLLVDRYIQFKNLRKNWLEKKELMDVNFKRSATSNNGFTRETRLKDSLLNTIFMDIVKNSLVVSKIDEKLSIIKVEVKAKDEYFAKSFNDAIVKNVNDFYLRTKTKKSLQNVKIMQHKTDSVRSVMNGSIYTAVAVADATPNLNPTRQIQRAAPSQKAQFSAETNKTILGSLVQNLEMAKVSLMKETPLLEVIDQPVLPLKKAKPGLIVFIILGSFLSIVLCSFILLIKRFFLTILETDE